MKLLSYTIAGTAVVLTMALCFLAGERVGLVIGASAIYLGECILYRKD